ncbi:hypothetical protein LVB77_05990 [Lysobacter sp. 5GHs7-4]|uniref:hypothetical protein n=1 Tax=Lysobacter sp. 5GHs7-4 TaxID=2904253 RepID=UPI001E482BC6|nr:hypothetical protein [Lysobacter sp. 5GHs7-4]UHQ24245.1 hypothetical protein LVB77_05990 [Lysobacter sp. 5GHs7-4]
MLSHLNERAKWAILADGSAMPRDCPLQHQRIEGDRAYCLIGTALGELVKIKLRTVFNGRGL